MRSGVSVMSGYRDESGYDPWAYETPGRPLRPYNWVQWIGVAFIVAGTVYAIAFLLGEVGVIPKFTRSLQPAPLLPLIGLTLVNSRREPGAPAGSEQLARNRKVLLITVAIVAPILIAAAAFDLLGAK